MRFSFIKNNDKEEVIVYAKRKNALIEAIEAMCCEDKLYGYQNDLFKELDVHKIECFIAENEKIYAINKNGKYHVKKRLYELEEMYNHQFIYINKSCLANLSLIDHFDASIGGSLLIVFKSGYEDYVSRRQIKKIKERLGIK